MCGLFGALLCCVGLCEGLSCVGGCKWREVWPRVNSTVWNKCEVGVGICKWPKDVVSVVSHVLGILEF